MSNTSTSTLEFLENDTRHHDSAASVRLAGSEEGQAQPIVSMEKTGDPNLVTWEGTDDPLDPKNWSNKRRWSVTLTMSAIGFMSIMVSTIIAPATAAIQKELRMSTVEAQMGLSAYVLAIAFGPLVLGPLSEVYGRAPIIHATNVWFLIWNIVCGFANTKGLLIAARFLSGIGASIVYALGGAIVGDVWRPEQRGRSIGIMSLIPLLGEPFAGNNC